MLKQQHDEKVWLSRCVAELRPDLAALVAPR